MPHPSQPRQNTDVLEDIRWISKPGDRCDGFYQGCLIARICPDQFGWLWEVYGKGRILDCGFVPRGRLDCVRFRTALRLGQSVRQINQCITSSVPASQRPQQAPKGADYDIALA